MEAISEIFNPNSPLRNGLYGGLIIGLVAPIVGVFFILRRMIFLGVVLPQISTAGITSIFLLQSIGLISMNADEKVLATIGSMVFTIGTILLLVFLEKKRPGWVEGRLGTSYVLAGALAILFLAANPTAEYRLTGLLRGEIIAIPNSQLLLLAIGYAIILVVLLRFRKEFLLVSYDREMAQTLGKNVTAWDTTLYLLMALTVSLGVLLVGPLLLFGLLIVPALAARLLSNQMSTFFVLSAIFGVLVSVIGFIIAYQTDWPTGPTDVVVACGLYIIVAVFRFVTGAGAKN